MRSDMRNEAHLVTAPNGHILSTDCWCEPNRIYWYTNQFGIAILVVEHDDDTLEHHLIVLANRGQNPDWITKALTPPWRPLQLPPHDPNERKL